MTNHIERTKSMIEVMQAYVDGEGVEFGSNGEWLKCSNPTWQWAHYDYRIAPSATPDTIDWSHVALEFKYMARARGGWVGLYTDKPFVEGGGQWNYSIGKAANVSGVMSSYRKGTVDWKDSLVIRPVAE